MSLCQFSVPYGKQKWPPGLWLTEIFSTSHLKPLNGIWRTLTGSKNSMSSNKFMFFGLIGKPRWTPGVWLAEKFLLLSCETAEHNSTKLVRKPDLNAFYQVFVFRANQDGRLGQSVSKGGTLYSCARYVAVWASCCKTLIT